MNRRWMGPISLLGLLIVLNVLSLTDRFLLAAFGTQIVEDLELSHQQFGLLTGLASSFLRAGRTGHGALSRSLWG